MKSFNTLSFFLVILFVSEVSSQSLFQHFARSLQAMHHGGHHHGENYRKERNHHGKHGNHHKKKDCNKHKQQAIGETHEHGEGMMLVHEDHHHHSKMMQTGDTMPKQTSSLRGGGSSSSSSSSSSSTSPSATSSKSQSSLSSSEEEAGGETSTSFSRDEESEAVIDVELISSSEEGNYEDIMVDMEGNNEKFPAVEDIVEEGAEVMEEVMDQVDEVIEETRTEPFGDSISIDEEAINGNVESAPESEREQEEPVLVREEEETNGSMVDLEDGLSSQMFAKLLRSP